MERNFSHTRWISARGQRGDVVADRFLFGIFLDVKKKTCSQHQKCPPQGEAIGPIR